MRRCLTMLAFVPALVLTLSGCRRDPVDQGIRALEQGNAALAEQRLDQATRDRPQDASAWANLGLARLKLDKRDEAILAFRQSAELDRDDARPLEFIASIHSERSQWKAALDTLNEAVRRDPDSPRLLTALAVAEAQIYGPQAARSRLADVLRRAPNYSPAVFNLAVIYRDALQNPAEAETGFRRYLELAPAGPHAAEARAALAPTPKPAVPPPAKTPVAESVPVAPPTVRPEQTAVARNPQAATEAYNRGVRSQADGNLDKAMQEYSRALQHDPSMANAHYNLGLTYRIKGNLTAARAAFRQALATAPNMADAHYMLALTHRELGDASAAIDELNALIQQRPQHADAHLALGLLYQKDPDKVSLARRELTRYLELAPNGASARDVRAWLKYHQQAR